MFIPASRRKAEPTTSELLEYSNTFGLPSSAEAESSIISAMLGHPDLRPRLLAKHPVEHFFHPSHASVCETIRMLEASGQGIDITILMHALRQAQMIEKVGGAAALSEYFTFLPTNAHIDFYSEILVIKFTVRKAIRVGANIVYSVMEMDKSAGATAEHPLNYDSNAIVAEVSAIAQSLEVSRDPRKAGSMAELMVRAFEWIEDKMENPGIPGYSTGLPNVDDATGGIVAGEAWLVAGGTSDGKTAFAMQIMLSMALDLGIPVAHYLGESLEVKWTLRCLAHVARVSLRNLLRGELNREELQSVGEAAKKLKNAPIYLEHCPGKTHNWIIADARDKVRKHGVKMWIVDYLQKFECGRRIDSREQQVAHMSAAYTAAAADMQSAVMILSQLNDDGMIRESRAPSHDADTVITLSVPTSIDKRTGAQVKHEQLRALHLGKARNEERGRALYFDFHGGIQRFLPRTSL